MERGKNHCVFLAPGQEDFLWSSIRGKLDAKFSANDNKAEAKAKVEPMETNETARDRQCN